MYILISAEFAVFFLPLQLSLLFWLFFLFSAGKFFDVESDFFFFFLSSNFLTFFFKFGAVYGDKNRAFFAYLWHGTEPALLCAFSVSFFFVSPSFRHRGCPPPLTVHVRLARHRPPPAFSQEAEAGDFLVLNAGAQNFSRSESYPAAG